MSAASQPLVSIVTPVYNEEGHLSECIESILAQTYQNWEYTILDNCSTDRSAEIARAYAAKDKRIRLQQNQRFLAVIPNHNAALRAISSESKYCKLLFGDDWMFPECLARMVAVAESHPSVGVVGAYRLQGDQVTCAGLPYPSTVVSGRQICREQFLSSLHVFGSATNVLYRADLVRSHDPFYNETNIHGDTEAVFVLLKSADFGFVHQVLTFTRLRKSSLRTTSDSMAFGMAGKLRLLVSHGQDFLTPDELTLCLARHLADYYRFLGKNLMLRRDKKFWDFHKSTLTGVGIGFSTIRLAKGALAELGDAVLNPKRTVERLLTRVTQPSGESGQKTWPAIQPIR